MCPHCVLAGLVAAVSTLSAWRYLPAWIRSLRLARAYRRRKRLGYQLAAARLKAAARLVPACACDECSLDDKAKRR